MKRVWLVRIMVDGSPMVPIDLLEKTGCAHGRGSVTRMCWGLAHAMLGRTARRVGPQDTCVGLHDTCVGLHDTRAG